MSQGRLSDDRLARAAAHGEPDAFAEIYARYNGALYGYCLSILHDAEDARDALQATMEKAFGAIADQRVAGGLRAWLFGIAHNEAISLTRTRTSAQRYGDELALAAAAGDPAERERLAQLVADLKTLPEQQRSALVLRELSGLGSSEIGSALGISPAAAKQAVYEARAALLAQSGGRDMDCRQVQMKLSEADGRIRRGRRLKAHLADCALCTAFAAAIPARRAGMGVLFPPLGAALAAKTLAAATGGGAAGAGAGHGAAAQRRRRRARARWQQPITVATAAVLVAAMALELFGVRSRDPAPPAKASPAPAGPARAQVLRLPLNRAGLGRAPAGRRGGLHRPRPGRARNLGGASGVTRRDRRRQCAARRRRRLAAVHRPGPDAAGAGRRRAAGRRGRHAPDGARAAALASRRCIAATAWPARPRPTCSSTRTTPWTGIRGGPRRWPRRASATCRSCSRSATRPATGAT